MILNQILALFLVTVASHLINSQKYNAGVAIRDITSVITEEMMYGYARKKQDSRGIHTRQYSRAFVVSDRKNVVAMVVVDLCMISQALKQEVIERLNMKLPKVFDHKNVLLMATHSHSFPGGFHTYFLYQQPSGGVNADVIGTIADGIVDSVVEAYEGRRESDLSVASDEVRGVSISRSAYAYKNNHPEDLHRYKDNTEKAFDVLRLQDSEGKLFGSLSFYGVHPTSVQPTNHLISSDSYGFAALQTHKLLKSEASTKGLVTAFAQSFSGDASPNINGTRCDNTNNLCTEDLSNCPEQPKNPKLCNGKGPTNDQFKDAAFVGKALSQKTIELHKKKDGWVKLETDIRFIHQWVNMSEQYIMLRDEVIKTCRPALGYAFGAGSTDGPGMTPFLQGTFETIEAVEKLTNLAFNKSSIDKECHLPKPILLHTGAAKDSYPWQPSIVPLQMIKIGSVVLVALPAEITTMAGRKMKEAIHKVLVANNLSSDTRVFIASISNGYSSYVTTSQEYMIQRYEGGSTIYGKDSLSLYTHYYKDLSEALAKNDTRPAGTPPPDLRGLQKDSLSEPKIDLLQRKEKFGDVLKASKSFYHPGETASVSFRAGNPRNRLATEINFVEVQHKKANDSQWTTVFIDGDWETKMHWNSACHGKLSGLDCTLKAQLSDVKVEWDIPLEQNLGVYRLVHHGVAKVGKDKLEEYQGVSKEFEVVK